MAHRMIGAQAQVISDWSSISLMVHALMMVAAAALLLANARSNQYNVMIDTARGGTKQKLVQ